MVVREGEKEMTRWGFSVAANTPPRIDFTTARPRSAPFDRMAAGSSDRVVCDLDISLCGRAALPIRDFRLPAS